MEKVKSEILVNEVIKLVESFGFKPILTEKEKKIEVKFVVKNGFESFPTRYKNCISMLLGGFLSEFYYGGDFQYIYILKDRKGIDPDDDKYGCLLHEMRLVEDDNDKDIFINRIDHFERITF